MNSSTTIATFIKNTIRKIDYKIKTTTDINELLKLSTQLTVLNKLILMINNVGDPIMLPLKNNYLIIEAALKNNIHSSDKDILNNLEHLLKNINTLYNFIYNLIYPNDKKVISNKDLQLLYHSYLKCLDLSITLISNQYYNYVNIIKNLVYPDIWMHYSYEDIAREIKCIEFDNLRNQIIEDINYIESEYPTSDTISGYPPISYSTITLKDLSLYVHCPPPLINISSPIMEELLPLIEESSYIMKDPPELYHISQLMQPLLDNDSTYLYHIKHNSDEFNQFNKIL